MSRNVGRSSARPTILFHGKWETENKHYTHEVRNNGFELMPLKAIGTNLLGSYSIKILEQRCTTTRLYCTAKFDSYTQANLFVFNEDCFYELVSSPRVRPTT